MPFCSHSVISCFVCWHNWTDSCLDSTEPHYVYNILQDMNGAAAPLYAPILALWCSCLYIYTVWMVYCAIVLHVWNKLEWAWPTWTWVCHFYLTKYDIDITQSQQRLLCELQRVKIPTGYKKQYTNSLLIQKINKLSNLRGDIPFQCYIVFVSGRLQMEE